MKRLGEILLDSGAIAIAELHTGLEACHYSGGRLGTQLLKFGFVDEHALLEALSEQLGVPSVASTVLRRAPDSLRRMVPLHVSRRLQVVVFEKKDGILGVAMTTPRSPSVTEEVVSYLGLDIKPHVATEVGILTALAEIKEETIVEAPGPPEPGFMPATDEWQRMWTPPKLRSTDLLQPRRGDRKVKVPMASTYPGLAPVPVSNRPAAVGPLDEEPYRQLLAEVEHRDDVGDLLLRRATAILGRSYLLAVHSGKVVGWLGQGAGVVLEDIQSFSVQQDASSILSNVKGGDGFCGPVPPGEVNDSLRTMLGDPEPLEVFICPLLVKKRVVGYLLGDTPELALSPTDHKLLISAAQNAGVAFEMLIMKKKILP